MESCYSLDLVYNELATRPGMGTRSTMMSPLRHRRPLALARHGRHLVIILWRLAYSQSPVDLCMATSRRCWILSSDTIYQCISLSLSDEAKWM